MMPCPRVLPPAVEELSRRIGQRAGNLFATKQLWCSGAVLVVVNRVLGGDLTQDQAIRLAAGLGDGLSGSGCICGALNGAALTLGLFLGHGRLGVRGNHKLMKGIRWLHDQFKQTHGATCCRVLLKMGAGANRNQYRACTRRTAHAAEMSAGTILTRIPGLIHQVDWDFLNQEEGLLRAGINIATDNLKP